MLYSPANAIYEIIIGYGCLATLFGTILSIPLAYSMYVTSQEEQERQNVSS
jgi:hypothetical protein